MLHQVRLSSWLISPALNIQEGGRSAPVCDSILRAFISLDMSENRMFCLLSASLAIMSADTAAELQPDVTGYKRVFNRQRNKASVGRETVVLFV